MEAMVMEEILQQQAIVSVHVLISETQHHTGVTKTPGYNIP